LEKRARTASESLKQVIVQYDLSIPTKIANKIGVLREEFIKNPTWTSHDFLWVSSSSLHIFHNSSKSCSPFIQNY